MTYVLWFAGTWNLVAIGIGLVGALLPRERKRLTRIVAAGARDLPVTDKEPLRHGL